jgi:hypothetical protein
MTFRYRIRAHESGNRDGSTEAGTIVVHLGGSAAVYANSADEVETTIRRWVEQVSVARLCLSDFPAAGKLGGSEIIGGRSRWITP